MSVPPIRVTLNVTNLIVKDLTPYLTQDSEIEIASRIESPSETNVFTAADVTFGGQDIDGSVRTLLSFVTPGATWYKVTVYKQDLATPKFIGRVLPNTIIINDRECSFSFTAVSLAVLLSETDATPLFRNRVDTGHWYIQATAPDLMSINVKSNVGESTFIFTSGDKITFGSPAGRDEAVVGRVDPIDASTWQITFTAPLEQTYLDGTIVNLATPYDRHVKLQTAVNTLFQAAGLPVPDYRVQLVGDAAAAFASPLPQDGLFGYPRGITTWAGLQTTPTLPSPNRGMALLEYTTQGVYYEADPPAGAWSFWAAAPGFDSPIDWKPMGSGGYQLVGVRRAITSTLPNITYWFWCYDYGPILPRYPFYRYGLAITVDGYKTAGPYNWSYQIICQQSTDGFTWVDRPGAAAAPVKWSSSGTTSTNLHAFMGARAGELPNGQPAKIPGVDKLATPLGGIELDASDGGFGDMDSGGGPARATASNLIYFTEIYDSAGPGSPIGTRIAWVDPGTLPTPESSDRTVIPAEAWPGLYGFPICHEPGWLYVYTLWPGSDSASQVVIFRTQRAGPLLYQATRGMPSDAIPVTCKINRNVFTPAFEYVHYMLSASPARGVILRAYTNRLLDTNATAYPNLQITPPDDFIARNADLIVVRAPAVAHGTPWPMVIVVGTQLYWIGFGFNGVIDYMDTNGLSCGNALAQLATLANAVYYVDGPGNTYFRTRNVDSNRSIGVLDDAACIKLRVQPVANKAYLYVRYTNEKDEQIYGEAGDVKYANGDSALALKTEGRYFGTPGLCRALAVYALAYWSTGVIVAEVEHEDDNRMYAIGNTFTITVRGVQRVLQIVECNYPLNAYVVRVMGMKLA